MIEFDVCTKHTMQTFTVLEECECVISWLVDPPLAASTSPKNFLQLWIRPAQRSGRIQLHSSLKKAFEFSDILVISGVNCSLTKASQSGWGQDTDLATTEDLFFFLLSFCYRFTLVLWVVVLLHHPTSNLIARQMALYSPDELGNSFSRWWLQAARALRQQSRPTQTRMVIFCRIYTPKESNRFLYL